MISVDTVYRFSECRVLVVDDDEINRDIVGALLESMGISIIDYGCDGIEGLDILQQRPPDLVVLDILMPRMDGLEMLRRLRTIPRFADTPVIVQTGNDTAESREAMFTVGATDYVTKPLSINEFQGRIKVHLKNLLLIRNLESQLARISRELSDAAALQRAMLPTEATIAGVKTDFGLKVDYCFEPSSELGGDFFGILPVNDHAIGYYLCDFAGHGVGAALNTVRLHATLDRLPAPKPDDPARYIQALNDELLATMTEKLFATLFLGFVNIVDHTFTFASAGAPNALLIKADHSTEWLDGRGIPLGLMPQPPYENRTIAFNRGDRIFLYSDALSEATLGDNHMVGSDGILSFVQDAMRSGSDRSALSRILQDFFERTLPPLADDLTMVWIEHAGM